VRVNNNNNNNNETPLYWAARKGHIKVVQFLTERGADVNACCSDGSSCLWTAAYNGHTDVVHALVSAGADVNLQRNGGASPLIMASQEGHTATVVMLLNSGADIEMRNDDGQDALWSAAEGQSIDVVHALIAHAANDDASVNRLQSPRSETTAHGHLNVMKKSLIEHKVNMSGEEDSCQDLLYYATASVKHEIKSMLQLLMKDCDDKTARMYGLDSVSMSVECGADIYTRDVDNLQPIDIASYCGHVDILRFLYGCLP